MKVLAGRPLDCAPIPPVYSGSWSARVNAVAPLIFCLILSGCATMQTATLPVPVSCVKSAPEKPATQDEKAILAMTEYAATLTVWTERLLLKGYAEKAEAVINGCK